MNWGQWTRCRKDEEFIASAMNEDRQDKEKKEEKERERKQRNDNYIPGVSGHGAGRMKRVILPRPWSQVWWVVCDMR
jgi:hypothetical protein